MNGFFADTIIGDSKETLVVGTNGDEEQILNEVEEEGEEEKDEKDVVDDKNNLSESLVIAASINPLSLLNSSLEKAPSTLVDPTSLEEEDDDDDDEEEEEEDEEEEGDDILDVSHDEGDGE